MNDAEIRLEVKFIRQEIKEIKKYLIAQTTIQKEILNELRRKSWPASTETKAAE